MTNIKERLEKYVEDLPFFEGILVGIYGNWLIAFAEKITYTNPDATLRMLQGTFFFMTFLSLILFFLFSIGGLRRKYVTSTYFLHTIFILGTILIEENISVSFVQLTVICLGLWGILAIVESERRRLKVPDETRIEGVVRRVLREEFRRFRERNA